MVIGDFWIKLPMFNPTIIMHMFHFLPYHVTNAKWCCCSILRVLTNPKFPYYQSWILYQNASCNKWMNMYQKPWEMKLNKHNGKETSSLQISIHRADIGTTHGVHECSWPCTLPYLCHNANMHMLKLAPSCNFMYIQDIILFRSPIVISPNNTLANISSCTVLLNIVIS